MWPWDQQQWWGLQSLVTNPCLVNFPGNDKINRILENLFLNGVNLLQEARDCKCYVGKKKMR